MPSVITTKAFIMRCCIGTTDGSTHQPILTKSKKETATVRNSQKYIVGTAGYLIILLNGAVFLTGGVLVPELLAAFPESSPSLVSLIVSMVLGVSAFASKCQFDSFNIFH